MGALHKGQRPPQSLFKLGDAQGVERSVSVTCCGIWSCLPRMDDIQLCNDIMDLKQELQNLVAIPGKHVGLQPSQGAAQRPPSLPQPALLRSGRQSSCLLQAQPHPCNVALSVW